MNSLQRIFLTTAGFFLAFGAAAMNPGDRVDNFRLLDHKGASHELYYLSDAKAIVVMIHGNGCQIVRNTLPVLSSRSSNVPS